MTRFHFSLSSSLLLAVISSSSMRRKIITSCPLFFIAVVLVLLPPLVLPMMVLAATAGRDKQQGDNGNIEEQQEVTSSSWILGGARKWRQTADDLFLLLSMNNHPSSSQEEHDEQWQLFGFQEDRFIIEEEAAAQSSSMISPHHSGKIVPFFPAFPGALSAFSSLLIMYAILHSKKKLSTVYHRIIFFMSSADILSSLAMAFHTIPMPPHLPREEEFPEYVFATTRMGNTATCNLQGFAYLFGIITLFNYNSMLCVYYACAIGLQMDDRRISRIVEPVCHFIVLAIALFYSIPPLVNDLYNVSPTEMWCVVSLYPSKCYTDENVECIRGKTDGPLAFDIVWGLAIGIGLNFLIVIVSFTMVIVNVVRIDRSVERFGKTCPENMREGVENARAKNKMTKVVVLQASAYIMAFVITNLFPFINFVTDESPMATQVMTLIFLPLQGFFNLLIFMGHKVYSYRRVNPGVSRCEVLKTFFFSSSVEEPMYISQLSRVEKKDASSGDYDDDEEEEDVDSYQDDVPASLPRSPVVVHRDPSAGDAVFFDENESKSTFSWMANEDGLFSLEPSRKSTSTTSREDYLSYDSEDNNKKKASSKTSNSS